MLTYAKQKSGAVTAGDMARTAGLVDHVEEYEQHSSRLGAMLGRFRYAMSLRARNYGMLYYLPPPQRSTRQIRRDRLFFHLCGVKHIIGPAKSLRECYPRDHDGHLTPVQPEWQRLIECIAGVKSPDIPAVTIRAPWLPVNSGAAARVSACLAQHGFTEQDTSFIAIAPGSNMPAKQWEVSRFAALGQRLIANQDCRLIVVGGSAEHEVGNWLIQQWSSGLNAAGMFTIAESAECLRRCRLFIGNDTGTMHLAAAVSTPCISLFSGRDSPGRWEPYGNSHCVIRHWTCCEGCMAHTCPVPDHPCMADINSDEVFEAAQKLLENIDRAPAIDAQACT